MIKTIVAAISKDRALGKDNHMLWYLPDDFKFFKTVTKGKHIIMGRKTYESIGKPLPYRTTIVVSRNRNFSIPGENYVVQSLEEALAIGEKKGLPEMMIVGGGMIYKESLEKGLVDRMLLTEIDAFFPESDTHFPKFDKREWNEVQRIEHEVDDTHSFYFDMVDYVSQSVEDIPFVQLGYKGNKNYLARPTQELLNDFGSIEDKTPDSGSAAAFSALMALEAMKGALKVSIGINRTSPINQAFKHNLELIDYQYQPRLVRLFNESIKKSDRVSTFKKKRSLAIKMQNHQERKEYHRKAQEELKLATEIPLEICRTNLNLIKMAFSIYDNGIKDSRDKSGGAISNLLASLSGSFYIIFLNLKSFGTSKWKNYVNNEATILLSRYSDLQKQAYEKVVSLYNEGPDVDKNQLNLFK